MQNPITATLAPEGPLWPWRCWRRAAQILVRRVWEIEVGHQMVGFVGHGGEAALIEVGSERVVAGPRKSIRDAANLIVEPPPLLNDHDAGPALLPPLAR